MIAELKLSNFTKTLLIFCCAVFCFAILSHSKSTSLEILRYSVVAGVIFILFYYYSIVDNYSIDKKKSNKDYNSNGAHNLDTNKFHYISTKDMYLELQNLISMIIKATNNKFETDIYVIDPDLQILTKQNPDSDKFSESISLNNQIAQKIFSQENVQTYYQKDFKEAWQEIFTLNSWRGSECLIANSIEFNSTKVGFIITYVKHFSDIKNSEKAILGTLGYFVTYSLKNLDKLEIQRNDLLDKKRILDVLTTLDFRLDELETYSKFQYLISSSFDYDCLTVSLKKGNGQNCIVKITDGINKELNVSDEFNVNGTLMGLPISTGKIISSIDWKQDYPNLGRYTTGGDNQPTYSSVLGVPIKFHNEDVGSIILERINPIPFSAENQDSLIFFGKILGSAIFWLKEYDKLYKDATHDGLSQLLNHQTFKERFQEEILRAERFQHFITVMMFDLDKFKRINDTLGHPYGDYVIQTVSNILKENVRAIDLVSRYGGEEFVVILINTSAENARPVGERIVETIAEYPFDYDGEKVQMTISAGMSEYPTQDKSLKGLIDYADQAMYNVKQKGGNDIILYEN
tara:strand:- start:241 stop:1962 length:1722 start_codon:yes stop_codon:yes gene_type:complete